MADFIVNRPLQLGDRLQTRQAMLCKGCKPSNDNAYGMAEGTIERYSRYAQEMQQIRKEEWED